MTDPKTIRPLRKPSARVLKSIEEKEAPNKGMVAAIVPNTGEYFLGANVVEAAKTALSVHPGGVFYFIRIGHPAVHIHRGGIKKA